MILLVSDSQGDARLLLSALKKAGVTCPMRALRTDAELAAYLLGEGGFSDRSKHPSPHVVILDLNKSLADGLARLTWIKTRPALREISVVVFAGSDFTEHIRHMYRFDAKSFVMKPVGVEAVDEFARHLCQQHWSVVNKTLTRDLEALPECLDATLNGVYDCIPMAVSSRQEIPTLLYVNDNADDRCLLEAAVARARATFRLTTVVGLDEAIDYLSAQGKFEDKRIHPPADLLLLDYHLRIHSALDLLRWLEQDNSRLPVIIFGGAQGTGSVQPCFEAGADAWIEKPKHASVWNDITAALQVCLASVPPDLGPLANISILSGRRLRAELRANVDEHKRLMQQRGQLTRLLDGTLAEQKEAKKKVPFQRRSGDAG
jgi:CheY-like chemotaxis protein